ncbi:hypothetical protein [Bradyrhizobium sp. CCBAU 45389]|uniref:hypothetical protein n=1 Tax=Bradyrhizobium sp. CCBAU 45389 TaxID=858429 RepID=UPI0023066C38|nr:hypothetical protein [Bradyrhizobium sp. CCBAU 45389]
MFPPRICSCPAKLNATGRWMQQLHRDHFCLGPGNKEHEEPPAGMGTRARLAMATLTDGYKVEN